MKPQDWIFVTVAVPVPPPHGQAPARVPPKPNGEPRPQECLYPELADPSFRITPDQCPCGA